MTNDENLLTKTNDGYVVELFVKTTTDEEIKESFEGITILEPSTQITEDDLFDIYKEIVEKMDYKPVTIRTPEIGKEITIIKSQLRAMLRAAKYGDLSIVFSQIATVSEFREYMQLVEECKKELENENTEYKKNIKMGIIIEIPSSALMSYEIARECDFFLIDTNSLIKYTFGNKKNIDIDSKSQIVIIKLIQQAIEGAHDAGVFCGICGDILDNVSYIPVLIGLGIDEFIIDVKNIEKTRNIICKLDKSDCKELMEEIFQLRALEDIEEEIRKFNKN